MSEANRIQGAKIPPLLQTPPATQRSKGTEQNSFAELLKTRQGLAPQAPGTTGSVRFSAHAQTRLQSRQITLDATHLNRLDSAVQRAAGKGAKDALVLLDNVAFVVNVPNRTVVTVADKENLKQNVFTNIDSAVIA